MKFLILCFDIKGRGNDSPLPNPPQLGEGTIDDVTVPPLNSIQGVPAPRRQPGGGGCVVT